MDNEILRQEIKSVVDSMGFGGELDDIELHEGLTSRVTLRMKSRPEEQEEYSEDAEGDRRSDHMSSSSMLIGERGNNLAALEYLLKRIFQKKYGEGHKFTLDINDYRMKKLEDLKQDVKAAAKEVRLYKKNVPLRPMSAFERRVVHLLLAEYPDISTESIGEEPNRQVVIKPYP